MLCSSRQAGSHSQDDEIVMKKQNQRHTQRGRRTQQTYNLWREETHTNSKEKNNKEMKMQKKTQRKLIKH